MFFHYCKNARLGLFEIEFQKEQRKGKSKYFFLLHFIAKRMVVVRNVLGLIGLAINFDEHCSCLDETIKMDP